jgi:hypothetical protein
VLPKDCSYNITRFSVKFHSCHSVHALLAREDRLFVRAQVGRLVHVAEVGDHEEVSEVGPHHTREEDGRIFAVFVHSHGGGAEALGSQVGEVEHGSGDTALHTEDVIDVAATGLGDSLPEDSKSLGLGGLSSVGGVQRNVLILHLFNYKIILTYSGWPCLTEFV